LCRLLLIVLPATRLATIPLLIDLLVAIATTKIRDADEGRLLEDGPRGPPDTRCSSACFSFCWCRAAVRRSRLAGHKRPE
jgi:hypothetical protein